MEFLTKLKFHEVQEKNIIENYNRNRQRVNEEYREGQRSLLASEQRQQSYVSNNSNANIIQGLGILQNYR